MDAREYRQVVEEAGARSAAEDWSAAAALWARVVEANPHDGRGWDQLAEARWFAGDFAGALPAFEQVRRLGVYHGDRFATFVGVVPVMMASCHAGLGDFDTAMDLMAEAMREGFVHVEEVFEHELFASLRADDRLATVLGVVNVDGMERDEGWRTDLSVVVREAYRRRPLPFTPSHQERFDAASARLRDSIPRLSDAQVAVELTKLIASLGDGHARLSAKPGTDLALALPIHPYLFEDGVYVVAAEDSHKSLLGERILAFDGRPIDEVIRGVDPLIGRDNERNPLEASPAWLRRTPYLHVLGLVDEPGKVRLTTSSGEVEIAAEPEDEERPRHFPESKAMAQYHDQLAPPLPLYLRDVESAYWFEYVPEHRLVYLQFNRIAEDPSESLAVFSSRLGEFLDANEVGRMVVDLRWNGGGNTFLVGTLLKRIIGARQLDHPDGIFLVVGRRTFSAAGNTAKYLEWLAGPSITVVGEPSGSSLQFIGETNPFDLPYSGMPCNISNLYWQGMTPLDRRSWIAPHLYAPPTFAAYKENRDPAMEAILAVLPGSDG